MGSIAPEEKIVRSALQAPPNTPDNPHARNTQHSRLVLKKTAQPVRKDDDQNLTSLTVCALKGVLCA